MTPEDKERRHEFEERAAIIEYMGRETRENAEAMARALIAIREKLQVRK